MRYLPALMPWRVRSLFTTSIQFTHPATSLEQLAAEREARIGAEQRAGCGSIEGTIQRQAPSQPPPTPTPTSTKHTSAPAQEHQIIWLATLPNHGAVRMCSFGEIHGIDHCGRDWCHQDSEKVHKAIKERPYMCCYANYWATKEAAKITLRDL
ncbi:hypothetical protein BDZ89DRAFT_1038192 [Hymenopellis radicata]|nr:hypothetical protein BDZ89DRAFT_1038192 [Hymenopellis radicata]